MSLNVAVVRHVPDPVRDEPVNVGVIVWGAGAVGAKFLGEAETGDLNLRSVPLSVIRDRQTYREWVRHWRRVLSEGAVYDPEYQERVESGDPRFLEAVSHITRGNYQLRIGAEYLSAQEVSLDSAVAEAYLRFVGPQQAPTVETEASLRVTTHRMLAHHAYLALRSRLEEGREFFRGYELVGRTPKGRRIPAVFDFGILAASERAPLLIDAVSLEAPEGQEDAVVDRARAVAAKAKEVQQEEHRVRALVTNGASPESDAGRYAMDILQDEGGVQTLHLADLKRMFEQNGGGDLL